MALIDALEKPLRDMLRDDDHDDLVFRPTTSPSGGRWQRKQQRFALNEGLKPDPVIERMRDAWRAGTLFEDGGGALFETRAGIGGDQVNGRIDVAKAETLLERAGAMDLTELDGPTGLFGFDKDDGIRKFQSDNELTVDGKMLPGGQTLRALKTQLGPDADTAKQDRLRVADSGGDSAVMNDASNAPGIDRPDKQVAVVPAIALAAPVAMRIALPWVIRGFQAVGRAVLGGAGTAAVGSLSGDTAKDKAKGGNEKREMLSRDELPPNSTGGGPELPDEKDFNTETFPAADPIDVRDLPGLPGFGPDDIDDLIEIFPDQSGELPQIIIVERRGSEETQALNTDIGRRIMEIGRRMLTKLTHVGGAFDTKGQYYGEFYLENRESGGTKGSSYLDLSIKNEGTGRILHVNTIDTRADGRTPSTREQGAAERILLNKESRDILVLVPKPRKGETVDNDALERFLEPLIEELANPVSELDPGDAAAPHKVIHNFGRSGG
jgi:hypothetical protein